MNSWLYDKYGIIKPQEKYHMRRHIEKIEDAVYERGYVYNIHYHLIWVTKYRRLCFVNASLVQELKDILVNIATGADIVVEEMEVMPEHVHLLVSFKPKYSVTDVVKNLKGSSARIFFDRHPEIKNHSFWGGKLWSPSYYVGTLGNMSKETVRKYIQNQYAKD